MTYRTLLMDLDGTLLDSNDAHAGAWTAAFRNAGFDVSFSDVRERIGMGAERLIAELSGLALADPRAESLAADYAHLFESVHLPRVEALPGARDLLARIKHEGFVLVLTTTARRELALKLLEHAQLITAFDHVVTADDGGVLDALTLVDATPSEAIAIGDTPYDVAAARAAGVAAIGLRSGGWPDSALAGACAVYADVLDLLTNFGMSPLSRFPQSELYTPEAAE